MARKGVRSSSSAAASSACCPLSFLLQLFLSFPRTASIEREGKKREETSNIRCNVKLLFFEVLFYILLPLSCEALNLIQQLLEIQGKGDNVT